MATKAGISFKSPEWVKLGDKSRMNIYACIVSYKLGHDGCAPTFREIVEQTGNSLTNVSHHLRKMRLAGLIEFIDGQERSIRVVGGHWSAPVEVDL